MIIIIIIIIISIGTGTFPLGRKYKDVKNFWSNL